MTLLVIGAALIAAGVVSRLFSLKLYRRISRSPSREAEPSMLPGTPWFTVQSDRSALKVIVTLTYAGIVTGMVLMLIGALSL